MFYGLSCLFFGVLCSRAGHVVFSFYTFHSTLHTLHFILHSILDTLRSTLCTLHSTLHTFLHTTFLTQHSTFFTLHPCFISGGSPEIILCNIFTPVQDWIGRGILDGGTGRRRCAQSRTTIIILTCNGKT